MLYSKHNFFLISVSFRIEYTSHKPSVGLDIVLKPKGAFYTARECANYPGTRLIMIVLFR